MRATLVTVTCLVLLAACGEDGSSTEDAPDTTPVETQSLDPKAFSTTITNPYLPMAPGTRWTYREVDEDGEELAVVVTVTSATKRVANGVTAVVVRDTVTTSEGEVVEDTFDWYAQDSEGAVWYLGEDTAEFEDGELVSHDGSFEAGVDGAQAGIVMKAEPAVGDSYRQEFYEGEAEDKAEVLRLGASVTVPAGTYAGVLVTADTNPLEPKVLEHKHYARGVGMVLALDKAGGGREELLAMTTVSREVAAAAGRVPLGSAY